MSREHQSKSEFNYKPPASFTTDLFAPEKTETSEQALSHQSSERSGGGIDLTSVNINMNPDAATVMRQVTPEGTDEELIQRSEAESEQESPEILPEEDLSQITELLSGAEQEPESEL
jgi:hypothetical protein